MKTTQTTRFRRPTMPVKFIWSQWSLLLMAGWLTFSVQPVRADQVIADDLIVQGSACIGLDCVNNESFGFDTIRLKENNTRIKFEDTSVGTFPTTDWQLTANDSASGGANKFSIEDITAGRVPFTITGSAPTNSLFVNSSGNIGLGTSTPVLDLHIVNSNTPAMRLEQDATGGFTAQTWDVAGNEANFFVRDVTGGSKLPLRIRPGAPTSSIDIAASGNVGIGTASPSEKLHVKNDTDANVLMQVDNQNAGTSAAAIVRAQSNGATANFQAHSSGRTISRFGQVLGSWAEFLQVSGNGLVIGTLSSVPLILGTNSANRIFIAANGNVGFGGITNPTNPIEHSSGAKLTAGGVWTNASSRAFKEDIHPLDAKDALAALKGLSPVHFRYKAERGEDYLGFIAEDVPELVATADRKGLSSMDIVAVLTKVVQEQQQTLRQQQRRENEQRLMLLEQRQLIEQLRQRVGLLENAGSVKVVATRSQTLGD